jgi:hypothetical protein
VSNWDSDGQVEVMKYSHLPVWTDLTSKRPRSPVPVIQKRELFADMKQKLRDTKNNLDPGGT